MSSFYSLSMQRLGGKGTINFSDFKGKAVLLVNVASKCGYTGQYKGLEALHKKYGSQGLVLLGVPCNQFGGQEPGTEEQISNFCSTKYNVTFQLAAKTDVNGPNAHPVFTFLKNATDGKDVAWNFEKFLVSTDGTNVTRFASRVQPKDIEDPIAKALLEKALRSEL
ncbi:glutathione peroxidase [Rhizoclosmatium globosum]|uniref:Glutathione peroxidase n=1 Tax=Rhizoclosmatium globosum TaxID=329046 RepID=A0A1Y2CJ02_9FUNG|nr:glutathione peroxidase [Rhizoclosmatium globosum]|eukprot:ORY47018.1 glutathione peroxidase [Rhizoclosmatium globosum]